MRSPVHLKLELAIRGVRLDDELDAATPLVRAASARDHASREIELVLPDGVTASCPVGTEAAARSPFTLTVTNDRFRLLRRADGDAPAEQIDVSVLPQPEFYDRETSAGTPMWQVATVHGSYISVDPASTCGFAQRGVACQFCTLQSDGSPDSQALRPVDEVMEVVRAAFEEGVAEFVYLHTGYYDEEDGGFGQLEPYVRAIKKQFDTLVAMQVHPPKDDRWIDRTYAVGVDALSYNVEVYDADLLAQYCQGRSTLVGRERYYEALAYAATVFPSGTVWSDLIVGLEPTESTAKGIDGLTAIGVLPVLSLFRPLDETALREHPLPDPHEVAPLYAHLYRKVREARINVQWMRELGYAITPIEARYFAGEDAKVDVAFSAFYRSRLGSRAARSLSKLRRRLRVRQVSESFDSSKL